MTTTDSMTYDLFAARALRDEGIERVSGNTPPDFKLAFAEVAKTLTPGEYLTAEELRARCMARGGIPHHHNAWGAAISGLVKRGRLKNTGRYVQATLDTSHARRIALFLVCEWRN